MDNLDVVFENEWERYIKEYNFENDLLIKAIARLFWLKGQEYESNYK